MALIPPVNRIGERFMVLDRIHSTNDLAQQQVAEGIAQHGDVLFAHEQYAGRGQMGKQWLSEPGQNLALSLLLENAKMPDQTVFHLSAWMAVSAFESMTRITAGDISIKWPNDLYWKKRKLGGMLIETGKDWTVAGIGININQTEFSKALTNPVSLRQITGKTVEPKKVAQLLVEDLNQRLYQWGKQGFEPLFQQYRNALFGKGEHFLVRELGKEKTICLIDVMPEGTLLIEDQGEQRSIRSGLEWMI